MGTFLHAAFSSKSLPALRRRSSLLVFALALLLAACGKPAGKPASTLSSGDRDVLAKYDAVRAALASDDLREAKRTAHGLAEAIKANDPAAEKSPAYASAVEIADNNALDRARDSFKNLSASVIAKAGDVQGFYVISCPMTPNGLWLQTSPKVDNPYMGKIMRDCGEVKK